MALLALISTGGYSVEILDVRVSSTRLQPILTGLIAASTLRLALSMDWRNFALLIFSFSISVLIAEFILRAIDESPLVQQALIQIHRPSDIYEYELLPDAEGIGTLGEKISINSQGMRDTAMNSGDRRPSISVIGDSFTFGMGVDLEETFTKQLQTQLRGRSPDINVLNYGVIGYSLWQYLEVLDRRVATRGTDLVIVALFLDDVLAPSPPQNIVPQNPFAASSADDFHGSSLWNVLRNAARRLTAKYRHLWGYEYMKGIENRKLYIGEQHPDHPYYKAQTGRLDEALYTALEGAIERLSRWSIRHQTSMLVAYIPDASQLHEPLRQDINRRIADLLAGLDLPFLDLTPAFEAQPDLRPLYLFPLDAHNSAAGHLLIAEQLAAHPLVRAVADSARPSSH